MNKAEILIIDDEPQIRKLLEITLHSNDYISKSALSAREGLIMASNHPPDLILLDLGLPDENGHVVLQKLRQWYTNPVIILSVQKNEEDIIRALDNGANDYLSKPFRTGELLARIRSALRSVNAEEGYSPQHVLQRRKSILQHHTNLSLAVYGRIPNVKYLTSSRLAGLNVMKLWKFPK